MHVVSIFKHCIAAPTKRAGYFRYSSYWKQYWSNFSFFYNNISLPRPNVFLMVLEFCLKVTTDIEKSI